MELSSKGKKLIEMYKEMYNSGYKTTDGDHVFPVYEKFNLKNKYLKKGIAITPVKFGISFTTEHLNQAGALVSIYTDGSVHLNHGGIEMGQGTYTKIEQLAAKELGLPFNRVKTSSTNTSKVPNTSASAASSTTDLNGAAILNAISKIKKNLALFVKRKYKIKDDQPIYENGMVKFKNKSLQMLFGLLLCNAS